MASKLEITRSSGHVFADMGFPPGEAQSLLLRATLMNSIEEVVVGSGLSQRACTERLGVTATRLIDLARGKIEKFSLDALVNRLASAGMRVELKVSKPPARQAA